MNCVDWEERIALYEGGDLAPDEAAEVERHLAACAGCQVFASGIRQSLALLREAHAEPLDASAFAAVRARVIGELERRPARRWWLALAAVCAAALVAAIFAIRTTPPGRPVALRAAPTPQVEVPRLIEPSPAPPPAVVVRVHHRRPRREPAVEAPKAETQPLVVKMVTDDPNIVIYWIADTRGEPK
jgi:anti-sigma factor RsiW